MKKRLLLTLLAIWSIAGVSAQNGYQAQNTTDYTLWWSGSTYKPTRTEIPTQTKSEITISAARGEWEPVQLVINPKKRLDNFRISLSELRSASGATIGKDNIKVYDVVFVNVTKPTDDQSQPGWYPDPLPLNGGKAMTLHKGENYPFWLDIYVPQGTPAGEYTAKATFSYTGGGGSAQFALRVWNFDLPKVPSMRSSFGVGSATIKQYHNLETDAEVRQVHDKYIEKLRDYRLAATSPFELYPMDVAVNGVGWEGGLFDSENAKTGKYSYKVQDGDQTKIVTAQNENRIAIDPAKSYTLSWSAKCEADKSPFAVGVRLYDAQGNRLLYENIVNTYTGSPQWADYSLSLNNLNGEVRSAQVVLYGAYPIQSGTTVGTVYFDDMSLKGGDAVELLANGGFEVDLDKISVDVDFTNFDKAARRYLDEFGFTSFNLNIQGMGSGTYYSQEYGRFAGFHQHTPEYKVLMKSYLSQIQDHLERNGWLGKEYVYWFDEPNPENYPFVREGMEVLKEGAPKLKRFITEHSPGEDIMDLSDISCTIWHKLDTAMVAKLVAAGKEYWSYLCCWPKSPWVSEFIDHPAVNLRIWSWMSYKWHLNGILMWQTTYWNSDLLSENGKLQNPWLEPMSFVTGYGEPYGKPIIWGNGDGRFFYPPIDFQDGVKRIDDEPITTVRLALVREGLEDYDYFTILAALKDKLSPKKHKELIARANELLTFGAEMFTATDQYNKDGEILTNRRNDIAVLIEQIQAATKK